MSADHHKKHDAFEEARPENIRRRKIVSILSIILVVIVFSLIA